MPELTSNEQLYDATLRHLVYLMRYSVWVRDEVRSLLEKAQKDIAAKLERLAVAGIGPASSAEVARLTALVESIQKMRSPQWAEAASLMANQMEELAQQDATFMDRAVRIVAPVYLDTVMPPPQMLRSIVVNNPFAGGVLEEWASTFDAENLRRVRSAIQVGMVAGEDMGTITRRVVKTFDLDDSGELPLTRTQIEAVTRTAVMTVANSARNVWVMENTDIIEKERFSATLDSRTTPRCRSLDGKLFPVGEGPFPPLHYRCRSVRIPAILTEEDWQSSWDEFGVGRPNKPYTEQMLVREFAEQEGLGSIQSRDTLPYGTKGAFDKWARGRIRELVGQVPGHTTYGEWFARQSAEFQRDVLGPSRFNLYQDGGLTLDNFVDDDGKKLTLADLARKDRHGFIDAGLDPDEY